MLFHKKQNREKKSEKCRPPGAMCNFPHSTPLHAIYTVRFNQTACAVHTYKWPCAINIRLFTMWWSLYIEIEYIQKPNACSWSGLLWISQLFTMVACTSRASTCLQGMKSTGIVPWTTIININISITYDMVTCTTRASIYVVAWQHVPLWCLYVVVVQFLYCC